PIAVPSRHFFHLQTMENVSLENVDQMLDNYNGQEAFEALSKMDRSSEVEWRLANAIYILSNDIEDAAERRDKINEGFELAASAFEKDPTNAEAAKQAAMLVGTLSEMASNPLEQMKFGAQFKKFLDHTIELAPEPDMVVLHMRGRFSFAIASLSWLERTMACRVFNTLPSCTYDDALKDLLAAEEIYPSLDTLLFIGKAYLGKGDIDKGHEYLTRVAESEGVDAVDEEQIEEAKKILDDF
ncbi:hypothetical protein PFISCL1PPCAC_2387, partial [Pristionchus fissidentatus]